MITDRQSLISKGINLKVDTRPDTRQATGKGSQQGLCLYTGSDYTGVSLGLGTHKPIKPFIFQIKMSHEIITALAYHKAFYSNLHALLTQYVHSSNNGNDNFGKEIGY